VKERGAEGSRGAPDTSPRPVKKYSRRAANDAAQLIYLAAQCMEELRRRWTNSGSRRLIGGLGALGE
jgi:hypothetical protein